MYIGKAIPLTVDTPSAEAHQIQQSLHHSSMYKSINTCTNKIDAL